MAKIIGIEGMTHDQLERAVALGGKFIAYQYIVSVLVLSFKRSSPIYFIPAGDSRVVKGLPWTGLALVAGWWGLPWGLIWTPIALVNNLRGGVDMTANVTFKLLGKSPTAIREALAI